ncbi:sensor histidine kinase [Rhizobium sp. XQZ8]|nr:sensor histidine kinase [Rhizobium populisoli]
MRAFVKFFGSFSLAKQFFFAGGLVTLVALLSVGFFVTDLIAKAITQNTAAATALYVDSVIAPILPDLTTTESLDESIERALDETLGQGALANRLISFRLWRGDGTALYSNDKALMGMKVPPDDDLKRAFSGQMVAEFELDKDEDPAAAVKSDTPVLEIYNPIHQPWSGEVIAVAEFYERANELTDTLALTRTKSWLAVVAVTVGFFLLLSAIVLKGSKTIENQRTALNARVEELDLLLRHNQDLSGRVRRASQNAASLNERVLRRVSADLHDGPVQLMAYASMRVESRAIRDGSRPEPERMKEVEAIKHSLDDAIREVRNICRGLALPDIETLPLPEILDRVVSNYRSHTGVDVELIAEGAYAVLPASARICIYRFVQEALNNGWKHADGKGQRVEQWIAGDCVVVAVSDHGPGFDPSVSNDGLGLSGLKDRVESLGGRFDLTTSQQGTTLTMSLKIFEAEAA